MRQLVSMVLGCLMTVMLVGGCGQDGADLSGLRIMVPNSPGGGYDITARTAAKVFEDTKIAKDTEVFNLPGAGGVVGLQRLVNERGNSHLMMLMGLGLVGSQYTRKSTVTLQQTSPIARLVQEPDVVVVNRDSPYQSITELVAAWRANPAVVVSGGGSQQGGPDHLATMLMAKAVGIRATTVNYRPFDGGGVLLAALFGNQVSFAVTGIAESIDPVHSGQVRALAVTGEQPLADLGVPTLRDSGINVVFNNWRGIVAPPDLSRQVLTALRQAVARLHSSAPWQAALTRNNWTDAYLAGEDFGAFMKAESEKIGGVLREIGPASPGPKPPQHPQQGHSEWEELRQAAAW